MEAIPQATQREITLESLALLQTRRSDVQYFNELLVQYPWHGKIRQVVPDNMLIHSTEPSRACTNYALEFEAVLPFLVMEYVSPNSERKDYDESYRKYEQELKVPYCLLFHPEKQDLRVYRHDGQRYVRLEPGLHGRCQIPELELEVGIYQHWVRFWHQGQLLELPAELQQRLDQQAEQLALQEKTISAQAQALRQREQTISAQAEALQQRENTISAQAEALQQLKEQVEKRINQLRSLVERRALKAARHDILERLPTTLDVEILDRWLAELE